MDFRKKVKTKRMNSIRISCKEIVWRQILDRNLAEGREVDLVNFLGDYDADYCRKRARKHSMIFEWTAGNDFAFFKKGSSP